MSVEIVCAGTSWGGLFALRTLLHGFGDDFPLPVVLVQHRHRDSNALLVDLLQECTALPVSEAEDKEPVTGGRVFVAPPNYHLLVDDGHFALNTDPPLRFSRPSIDVTLDAVAESYGRRAAGLILTGANDDGAEGLRRLADLGGTAVVQDPAESEMPTMPLAALRRVPDAVRLPLERIPGYFRTILKLAPLPGDQRPPAASRRVREPNPEAR
ncbi:MAG TPA: chemotaxis protein CheB [Gemmatimonadaceae bacterium]|nr:chemotaxis protein CheB [Gemmatimonadaceae bacterium]